MYVQRSRSNHSFEPSMLSANIFWPLHLIDTKLSAGVFSPLCKYSKLKTRFITFDMKHIIQFETHFLYIIHPILLHQEFKHNNSEPNKTRLNLINYRESWKVISFQYIQLKPVQKIKQNGTKDLLYSSVEEKVAMPVYQTKTSQSCWNFVTHLKLYPSNKVNLWETLQITLYYVFVNEQSKNYMLTQVFGRSLIFDLSALSLYSSFAVVRSTFVQCRNKRIHISNSAQRSVLKVNWNLNIDILNSLLFKFFKKGTACNVLLNFAIIWNKT